MQTLRPESAQVPEDDIRLTYARTFFNAFNGFEMEDIGGKLAKYCVEDCVMTVKWLGEKGRVWVCPAALINDPAVSFLCLCRETAHRNLGNIILFSADVSLVAGNPCGPNSREVRGILGVTTFLEAILVTACPDAVMQLQDSKLRVKPDRSSYLLCKYTFSGTQVTRIEPVSVPVRYSLGAQLRSSDNLDASASAAAAGGSARTGSSASVMSEPAEQIAKKMRTEDGNTSTSSTSTSNNAAAVIATAQALAQPGASKGRSKRGATEAAESATVSAAPQDEEELVINRPMAGTMMLPVAIKMNIVGTLIIHINANNKIHRFEYIQKVIKLS
jgi:hypothetical protein